MQAHLKQNYNNPFYFNFTVDVSTL